MINLSRNKNICCGLKKVVAKGRARVYSEQQILALLLVFHQAHNLSRKKCARVLANQPISALHFFNPQQMFLLRVKLIMQGEKRDTSIQTCNETMLRAKFRVFCLVGDTELARAVDVVMARAKRIYILIIRVNKLFSKRNRKHVLRVSIGL